MPNGQTVIISANPRSGSHSRLELIQNLQREIIQAGFPCELITDLQGMATRAKLLASNGELRTVIAAGGDGTAAIVASLIPEDVPLTLFPTGSENLLAKHFSVGRDISNCVHSLAALRTKPIDVMMVNDRIALLMASIGYDAEVVRRVHLARKSHVTRWTYWMAIFKTLTAYRWPSLRILLRDECGNLIEEVTGSWIFVFNVPRYAAGLSIIDDAIEDDGLLDVGVFEKGGLLMGIWNYLAVILGTHHAIKRWRRFRAAVIEIDYEDRNLGAAIPEGKVSSKGTSCQTDGDWACELPVTIKIMNRKLRVVV